GYVLAHSPNDPEPGFVAIDLDDCRDPVTGNIDEWAREIVKEIDSYTEVSPSGRGLRVILKAKLPGWGRKKGKFECYNDARYVTITGQRVPGTPAGIAHRQAELDRVHQQVFGERPQPPPPGANRATATALVSDADLIAEASSAKGTGKKFAALWGGDFSGYASRSEADLALVNYLAFRCGPDAARIDALFRQSGLYRPKWDRPDYRDRTIAKALEGRTEFYDWSRAKGNGRRRSRGATRRALAAPGAANGAGGWRPGQEDGEGDGFHLTDLGNAQRFAKRHGGDVRHCYPWKQNLVWDGCRWGSDDSGEVERRAKE